MRYNLHCSWEIMIRVFHRAEIKTPERENLHVHADDIVVHVRGGKID